MLAVCAATEHLGERSDLIFDASVVANHDDTVFADDAGVDGEGGHGPEWFRALSQHSEHKKGFEKLYVFGYSVQRWARTPPTRSTLETAT